MYRALGKIRNKKQFKYMTQNKTAHMSQVSQISKISHMSKVSNVSQISNISKTSQNLKISNISHISKRDLNVSSKCLEEKRILASDLYDIECEDNVTFLDMTKYYVDQAIKVATPLLVNQNYIGQRGVGDVEKEKFVKGFK